MIRIVLYLLGVAAVAAGMSWLADRPGSMIVNWQGYELETTVFRAVVLLSLFLAIVIFVGSLLRQIWSSPAMLGNFLTRRRQERGLDALSSGMIAIGAGDRSLAARYAVQARKALPNEPLTQLLRAQAAQLSGDRATSRRIFEAMLGQPDTEQLGLRGLFLEAQCEGEEEAAQQFAERALRLNPRLGWPIEALFELQCREGRWDEALETLATAKKYGHLDKAVADRRRAVLLTALAQETEDGNGAKALEFASEAHNLAPDLIPAAAIAGRQHAARGSTAKVAKVIERTWKLAQHPELALVYAYARPGDSPRDRLEKVKRLAQIGSHSAEAQIALATAAIDARAWREARQAIEPLLEDNLSQRACTLMARIEGEENKDAGRVREWLARAADAPRDPAWTADGVVSERWAPVSPVTGALDAFQWKVPPETTGESDAALALKKIEELVMLGTRPAAPLAQAENGEAAAASGGAIEPGSAVAAGLRVRKIEPDRPITVEAEPVDEPGPKPGSVPSTGSAVQMQSPRRPGFGASRDAASDAIVAASADAGKSKA
ncbi:MAG: heme biosynthesis protein HemY [Hyphomicrobiaceae bacterium]